MKEVITVSIQEILKHDERVIFAYLFGSFILGEDFRDIDIAIYATEKGVKDPFGFTSDLKIAISKKIEEYGALTVVPDRVDIALLNNASLTFQMEVLTKGILLVDKDYDLRTTLIEAVSNKYRDYEQLQKEASLCL